MPEYIRHSREHIKEVSNEPFGEDVLGRKEFANLLTNIVTNYSTGFVMALNGAWGTGKSVLSLRQLEKYYAHAKLVFSSYGRVDDSEWLIAIMLIIYKFDNGTFNNIVDKSYSLEDYAMSLRGLFDFSGFSNGPNLLGALLYFINTYLNEWKLVPVPNDFKFPWSSQFSETELDKMSRSYYAASVRDYRGLPLSNIISKICFIEQFISRVY